MVTHDAGLTAIGARHRIVHRGMLYTAPTLADAMVLKRLEQFSSLAPRHQLHNLAGICPQGVV
jgi:acetate kinase